MHNITLFNTLTRQLEALQPIQSDTVSFYSCGPTVYNYYHIGNLRNAVFNDTLRRTLETSGYSVKHVMNITDVGHLVSDADEGEDKLETGAKREGKTVWEVAEYYTQAFKNDMAALNVLPPNGFISKQSDPYARATEFIDQQIEMVRLLVEKGFAYQTKQAIYFDVTKQPTYGTLSGQKLADKEVGARQDIVTDPEKKHPQDFAIWFFTVGHFAEHTMHWPSPWGDGFPGWHLECSAIIHATLGDPIDIHTGGVDHIGTHHANEIAQTLAAYDNPLANMWLHNEFILVDGAKMAKSKQNSYTLKDVTDKGFAPLALRLLYLQAHYRSELSFSWENLQAAAQRLQDLYEMADLAWQASDDASSDIMFAHESQEILDALANDLNTPVALAKISALQTKLASQRLHTAHVSEFRSLLKNLDDLLGLNLAERPDITSSQKSLLAERAHARQQQDWARSDELRDTLQEQGIHVRDNQDRQMWFRA